MSEMGKGFRIKDMRLAVTVGVLVLLELVLGEQLSLFDATPHFLFVAALCIAMRKDVWSGTVAGFACGLACDLLGAGPVGICALVYMVAGYLAGRVLEGELTRDWKAPALALLIAALAANILVLFLRFVLGMAIDLPGAVLAQILIATVVDGLVGLVACWALAHGGNGLGMSPSGLR